jgi:hypothetical protein
MISELKNKKPMLGLGDQEDDENETFLQGGQSFFSQGYKNRNADQKTNQIELSSSLYKSPFTKKEEVGGGFTYDKSGKLVMKRPWEATKPKGSYTDTPMSTMQMPQSSYKPPYRF